MSRVHFSRQIIRHVESAQPHKMTDGGAGRQTNRKIGRKKRGRPKSSSSKISNLDIDISSPVAVAVAVAAIYLPLQTKARRSKHHGQSIKQGIFGGAG
jgi:hypothetical protein